MAMSKMVVDHQACLGFRIRDKQKKQKEKKQRNKKAGEFLLEKMDSFVDDYYSTKKWHLRSF